ncbi:SDR family NAD(P)-dependent oxidoreductase [Histidinibacterium lentulum]|uniref:SDR family oxidoreductase n=1 Tax=Histidinibacterium lentulum TaxID=2480588 RepID=A0A3N2QRP6_9RHOB|nr:SDR family NAD(P)-dependent oxidoreductase [Histidinibacterium lentulum]ROT97695.1 SDR family oxidoreductase [Histidinibacterium lentulum]
MTDLLEGRTALVTGAARGIGHAIAAALARHGARVALADLDGDATAAAAARIPGARACVLDVTDADATERVLDALAADGWTPDIVVPNAGILLLAPATDIAPDEFRKVLEVNLTGAFVTARAAARRMGEGGRIVFTSSLFGIRGGSGNAAYAASKFGMVGLMESMAADLAPRGIRVNAVAPGQIQTEMIEKLVATRLEQGLPDPRERLIARIPMGRMGTPEEVAGAYVYLASSLANYVTGQTLVVDGGWQVG